MGREDDSSAAVAEAAGVAAWLHVMAERSGISTEDHIKLRYAATMIEDRADDISVLVAALREQLSADDSMVAFLIATDPKKLRKGVWGQRHRELSERKRNAREGACAAIAKALRAESGQ